ncbi:helix-turn-helix domain-containing protein [Deinococcus radiotolerans]|uniref:HTH cro/C1-type domain-containing protein n=1 Tax=Deinococcus radiotolerans TaxID=1309407 RepID=A0ABQ2FQH3_9DEIO|nr:helix-turn-helix transcriptional regulator [Deinococcus radiotolerans]GGL16660.1 hypothetical protein GCM10010844_39460 [Deinococcus radiotolerans]
MPLSPEMRVKHLKLVELRGSKDPADVAAELKLDKRTLAGLEAGRKTEQFRYNTINRIAAYYGVAIDDLIEPVPAPANASAPSPQHQVPS